MKRICVLLVIFCFLSIVRADEREIKSGLKIILNWASTEYGNNPSANANMATKLMVGLGVFVDLFRISDTLSIQPELNIIMKGRGWNDGFWRELYYLELPLLLKLAFPIKGSWITNVYGLFGPYGALSMGGAQSDGVKHKVGTGWWDLSRFEGGIMICAGVQLFHVCKMEVGYGYGLTNIWGDPGHNEKNRNLYLSLRIPDPLRFL
jgi:hypothetical protein